MERMLACVLCYRPLATPATGRLLPAACCLLPAACCLLPAACCLLPAACCLLLAYWVLLAGYHSLLPTDYLLYLTQAHKLLLRTPIASSHFAVERVN